VEKVQKGTNIMPHSPQNKWLTEAYFSTSCISFSATSLLGLVPAQMCYKFIILSYFKRAKLMSTTMTQNWFQC